MTRHDMIERIGSKYMTANIEGGEYSYVQAAGSRENLEKILGRKVEHFKLDIRFEYDDIVVLVETKQNFIDSDIKQLREYLDEEKALNKNKKIICILANINDDKIRVWKSFIDDEHILKDEKTIDSMEHYKSLFAVKRENNREKVLKNTYKLNETLHKKDIDEHLRSQFVGSALLYIKEVVKRLNISVIDDEAVDKLKTYWGGFSAKQIIAGIEETLFNLLNDSDSNKDLKINLLQKKVLEDQKVESLTIKDWIEILEDIVKNIYKYINTDSPEGQDILSLFFIAFNKYIGKADRNQAFTPDHITHFMCRVTGVDRTKKVFDDACGSGSFLVQAMIIEMADCNSQNATDEEKRIMREDVVKKHVYGIEIEEKAFGLSTTNMLIHGDGNSNIIKANLFHSEKFIRNADPDIILMNPPYNAKPITIPAEYKKGWKEDAKEDPTKGMIFIKYLSDIIEKMNAERVADGKSIKEVKAAVLLPVSAAIGSSSIIADMKEELLRNNTLDAVFTLPNEIFYPGASVSACCMVFTLGRPHVNSDGTVNKTFFGYFKEDGHKKKKYLGRVEQFDKDNKSVWKKIEEEWLDLYRNKTVKDDISAMHIVSASDEWLCEAYMKTDYSKLSAVKFQRTINNYCSYLVKAGKFPSLEVKENIIPELNVHEWKMFSLGRLFDIKKGKRLTSNEQEDGDNIYIGAVDSNNGVTNYISQAPIHEGNTITVNYDGSVGEAFYQPEAYWASDDVNVLYSNYDGFNEYIGLFIVTVIRHGKNRFSYGRKWTLESMKATDICLPVKYNRDGTIFIDKDNKFSDNGFVPDWQFMENYIKALPYGDRI